MGIEFEPRIVSSTILIEWSDDPRTVKLEAEMPSDLAKLYDDWLHEIEIERAATETIHNKYGAGL
jgi:hypothetical protein